METLGATKELANVAMQKHSSALPKVSRKVVRSHFANDFTVHGAGTPFPSNRQTKYAYDATRDITDAGNGRDPAHGYIFASDRV